MSEKARDDREVICPYYVWNKSTCIKCADDTGPSGIIGLYVINGFQSRNSMINHKAIYCRKRCEQCGVYKAITDKLRT